MENVHEILKKYGVEVPADKKADFDKDMLANYKTVTEVEKRLGKSLYSGFSLEDK